MCGIVGIVGKHQAAPILVDGLRRLEYRGYDSAGIATVDASTGAGRLDRRRALGKLVNLADLLVHEPATPVGPHMGPPPPSTPTRMRAGA